MATRIIEIKLTSDECNYLERLLYQNSAYRQVIECLIEHNKDDSSFLTSPLFVEYNKEYQKIYAELKSYETLLVKNYTPVALIGKSFEWKIEPSLQTMQVTFDSEVLNGGV